MVRAVHAQRDGADAGSGWRMTRDHGASGAEVNVSTIFGVDFSGAAQAGKNIWIASAIPVSDGAQHRGLRLIDLQSIESLCGCAARSESLDHLVKTIASSQQELWGMDFP